MNKNVVAQKANQVEEIYNDLKNSTAAYVVEYRGLSVAKLTELRKALRKEEASLSVYKNSLVTRAVEKAGYKDLEKELKGPNAIVLATKDVCNTAKILTKFAKKNEELVIKGAIVEGKVVSSDEVKTVAKLPNKEGLISMFLGCLQASVRDFACVIKAVADSKAE